MASRWNGRVALVTGASAGIGFALTQRLAQMGMKTVACARNIDKIQELAKSCDQSADIPGSVHAVKCDVTKEDEVYAMFAEIKAKFGGVDVCVNNAGLMHDAPLLSGDMASWRNMLDVNVLGLCLCTREAVKSMRERNVDDGHIIHVNSMSGHRVLPPGSGHFYSATKYAVTSLTEGLRHELGELNSNIRISSVSPGLVKTEFIERSRSKEVADQMFNSMKKVLQAEDIADAIVYALEAPPHIQIHDIQVRSVDQKV